MTDCEARLTRIQLTEGLPLETSLRSLVDASGVERDVLEASVAHLVKLQPSFDAGMVRLIPGSKIGSIRIGALCVDVLPRMAVQETVTLIRYALGGKIDSVARTDLPPDRVGLEELLCTVLADEATRIRQVGWSRQYEKRRERLTFVRGPPDFLGSFPWDEERISSLVCNYHLLTGDNLDNRLVRAALEIACLLEVTPRTKCRIFEHRKAWAAIAAPCHPTPRDFEAARSRYTGLSEHYRLAHNLGELLVLGLRPSTPSEVSGVTFGGFSLDMPWLFEKFTERLIGEIIEPLGMRIEAQQPDRGALLDASGGIYRRVRPDLVVYRGDRPVAIIDAKYKEYWPGRDLTDSPSRRISNEDIYQLFFYAQRLQRRYGLPSSPKALILAPVPASDERGDQRVVGSQYTEVTWRAGSERAGRVQLVLVPLTDILRGMASMKDWTIQQSSFVSLCRTAVMSGVATGKAVTLRQENVA